jgi:hypothetical protein
MQVDLIWKHNYHIQIGPDDLDRMRQKLCYPWIAKSNPSRSTQADKPSCHLARNKNTIDSAVRYRDAIFRSTIRHCFIVLQVVTTHLRSVLRRISFKRVRLSSSVVNCELWVVSRESRIRNRKSEIGNRKSEIGGLKCGLRMWMWNIGHP